MHEARLAHDLVDRSVLVAACEEAGTIEKVHIQIGALNHATPTSLCSILEDAASGTTVADVEWDIDKSEDASALDALDVRLVSVTIVGV